MARCPTCHRRLAPERPCPVHGGAPAPAAPAAGPPPRWDEPVAACLGAGGFATVWQLAGERVLKVAHAAHDLARARLAREAEALAAIGSPAVPALVGHGVLDDGRPWLAMQRVAGATFAELLADDPVRPRDAVALAVSALAALGSVHAAGFVHRDIKPDNLVRTADGRVVVIDLGLARRVPDDPADPTRAHVQVGSVEYMAPEQRVDAAAVDARADLYALGCVLFELCAGRPPFVGDAAALERAHAALRPPRLGALAPVSAALEVACAELLAKERAHRPASAAEAGARLAAASDDPSAGRLARTGSMLGEGKQPVVLLFAELPRVDRALLASLTGRRLAIASQRGRRVLAGVLGAEHADPAGVALAAARDLAASGARVALHLEALRVSSAPGGAVTLHGEPVARPESWLPPAAWSGVVVTRALAAVVHAPLGDAPGLPPEFRALGEGEQAVELVGRDALLTDLSADAAATLHASPARGAAGPAFGVLLGEPGVGKTAFATALGKQIAELGVRVLQVGVPAPGTAPGHAALAAALGVTAATAGPVVRGLGDALRDAARAAPLAVILDDLHHADHELLDALEYATLGGEPLPLWLLGVAAPRLAVRRPQLGARAERSRRDVLPPLDEDAAVALAAALLRPAEYPPLRALRQLVAIARGNPLHLAVLAREIHERGGIRPRPGGAAFLDTTALDALSPAALGPWLAARALAELSPELASLARVCAVLGGEIAPADAVAIVEAVELAGGATTPVDVAVGLRELERAGVLAATAHGVRFRQQLVEDGVYATTDAEERRALHRAALAHWRAAPATPDTIARLARHAEAAGEAAEAARAYAALGAHALDEHRFLDADQAWSGALRHAAPGDAARARALLGRGQARYRLQRMREAIVDLEDAAALARAIGDAPLEVEALLVEAIALDFLEGMSGDFTRTKAVVEAARARLAGAGATASRLALELALADARQLFREQRFDDAIPALRRVLDDARAAGHHEAQTIAALLLGPALADRRELDEAERVFAELVASCVARGDRFHLTVAYVNRSWLWAARGDLAQTEADLERVIQLARESGVAFLERAGTHNLAEHRLWRGQLDPALALARRGLALQTRSGEGATQPDRLLLARVLAARGERDELAAVLETLAGEAGLTDEERATLAVLDAVARDDREALRRAIGETATAFAQLRLELGVLAAARGALPADLRTELRALAEADPVWSARTQEL